MAAGRPTDYTEELADEICERLSNGESLRSICSDEYMPAKTSVFRWLDKYTEFSDQYARAREEQAEFYADEIISIADGASNPVMVDGVPLVIDGKTVMRVDAASVAHARLMSDNRKWVASKLKPKSYGDKIAVGGADDLPPIKSGIDASKLSKEALKELMDARDKQE